MDDAEVIEAFLAGAGAASGPLLNVERGALKVQGWWPGAYRVSGRTFLVRDEEAPAGSTVAADLAAALKARGLRPLGGDFVGIAVLTYTMLDLGYAPWVLWSTDAAAGEADLNAAATEESFL
ncbi:MAG TPA: hypothetical protein VNT52_18075 [Acidimicrobiales bacterium]|nr:hypothetical protein [Acidimicrobiales bacterium]